MELSMIVTHTSASCMLFRISLLAIIRILLIHIAMMSFPGNARGQTNPECWLKEAEAAYHSVTNYTAVFYKRQRVDNKLLREETILIKFRKPFSLYMVWTASPHKGRYCQMLCMGD